MDKRNTVLIAGIVGIAVLVLIVVMYQGSTIDMDADREWANTPAEEPKDVVITPKTVITAKRAYQSGTHTIAGEIPMPTPCHVLAASATSTNDGTKAFIEFTSSMSGAEMCAQVITPARFKVSVKANKDAEISATLNGQEVVLNLIEAGPNENLDDFELYIKG